MNFDGTRPKRFGNLITISKKELQDFIKNQTPIIKKGFDKAPHRSLLRATGLKDEDFDIKSAKIVSKIKPLGLKKPLVAYILFKAFFTVNISKQLSEYSKFYLNLMKK